MTRIGRCLMVLCMGWLLLTAMAGAQTGAPEAVVGQPPFTQEVLGRELDAIRVSLLDILDRQIRYQRQLGIALGAAILLLIALCVVILRQPVTGSSDAEGQVRFLTPRYIREMTLFQIQLAGIRRRQDKIRLLLADVADHLSARKQASGDLHEALEQLLQEAKRLDDRIESFLPTRSK